MRLIDGDALLETIEDHCVALSCCLTVDEWRGKTDMKQRVIEDICNAPTFNGWISVKDRLPVEKENPLTHDFAEVICFYDFGGLPRLTDIRMCKYGKPSWATKPHFWYGPQNMDGIVTHWMPLPPLPTEKH